MADLSQHTIRLVSVDKTKKRVVFQLDASPETTLDIPESQWTSQAAVVSHVKGYCSDLLDELAQQAQVDDFGLPALVGTNL